ncbi:MAG: hypothetical protein QM715_01495 [Nibricoccus sp.]
MTVTSRVRAGLRQFIRIFALLTLASSPAILAAEIETTSASAEDVDKALKGKLTYNFVVLKNGEIVDQDGRHLTAKTAKDYLARAKPEPKAAYIFWIPDPTAVEIVKSLIGPFSDYGATMLVIREKDKSQKPKPPAEDNTSKTLMMVGDVNPASLSAKDKAPKMSGRPKNLRPGKLPARVRYVFRPDAEVVAAAKKAEELLLGKERPDLAKYFDKKTTFIQPGAWNYLSYLIPLHEAKTFTAKIELGTKVVSLDGKLLTQPTDFSIAVDELRSLIAADGGGAIRAFTTAEMDLWWTFISIDIEEPVFVLETKGGKYRFVIALSEDHVFCFDELNFFTPQKKK